MMNVVAGVNPPNRWDPNHKLEWTPVDASDFDDLVGFDPASLSVWFRVRRALSGFIAPVLIVLGMIVSAQLWVVWERSSRGPGGDGPDADASSAAAFEPAAAGSAGQPSLSALGDIVLPPPPPTLARAPVRDARPEDVPARVESAAPSRPEAPVQRVASEAREPAGTAAAPRRDESRPSRASRTLPPAPARVTQPVPPRVAAASRPTSSDAGAVGRTEVREADPIVMDPPLAPEAAAADVPAAREPAASEGARTTPAATASPAARAMEAGERPSAATNAPAASTAAAPAAAARALAEQGIRAALARFESAYEQLDADAAKGVWPSVDQRALARAFGGLKSQELTFTGCQMAIAGVAASVDCDGFTTFVPRVGAADPRTQPRRWTFQMRKAADDRWTIREAYIR